MKSIFRPVFVTVLCLGLVGCGETFNFYFRFTVEVEADGHTYSGSSVMYRYVRSGYDALENIGGGFSSAFQGEAVPVDIGKRGTLFMSLRKANGASIGSLPTDLMRRAKVVPDDPSIRNHKKQWVRQYRGYEAWRGTIELKRSEYPWLYRFRDQSDVRTVEHIDP